MRYAPQWPTASAFRSQDNLESSTYEVFEQDPVKYVNYEEVLPPSRAPLPPSPYCSALRD